MNVLLSFRTYFLITLIFLSIPGFSQYLSSSTTIDSLIQVIPNQTGEEKFASIFQVAMSLSSAFDNRGMKYIEEGINLFTTLENPSRTTYDNYHGLLYFQTHHYWRNVNLSKVLENCEALEALADEMEDKNWQVPGIRCNTSFFRALVFNSQNKKDAAITAALKAIDAFENPDTFAIAMSAYAFLGARYGEQKKFVTANKYFEKSINFYKGHFEATNHPNFKANLVGMYFDRGEMYAQNELYEQALPDLKAAIKYAEGISTPFETLSKISLSNVYSEIGRTREAYRMLKEIEPSINTTKPREKQYFYKVLHKVAAQLGKMQEAYVNLNNYKILNDSVVQSNNDREIAELQTQYETKEKEIEISGLLSSNKSKNKQNSLLWFLVGGLSLLAGGIAFQNKQKRAFDEKFLLKDKEVLELKENFFMNITHQLRTPLSLIIAPLKELEETVPDPKSQQKIGQALNNSNRLLELFNQLLDWNKIEEKALKINPKVTDLSTALNSISERYQELANQKEINFIATPITSNTHAEIDFDKVEKIIGNLITNAIKFTPNKGEVKFETKITGNNLNISVEDNGIGIPKDALEKVFEKYYKVNDGSQGAGFGLTFANELTKLLNGKLSVQSEPNVKTVFTLNLPLQLVKEKQYVPIDNKIVASRFTPSPTVHMEQDLTLLVIEDNLELNNYLTGFFDPYYDTLFALNKKDALKIAYEHAPDVIICDVMLPDGTGYDILDELKNNTQTKHIPILMLTAKANPADRKTGLEKGANGWLTKPFDPYELSLVVNNLMQNRQKAHEQFNDKVENLISNKSVKEEDPFLEKLLTILNENISNEYFSIDELASNFPINRTHFFQKVKAASGKTPHTLLKELRLKKARLLIKELGKKPKEAALLTGFVSLSHFSRSYKNFFNENPSETFVS